MEPTGAPSAFERQNITESNLRVRSATLRPEATEALKMRAPSRWTRNAGGAGAVANIVGDFGRIDGAAVHVVRIFKLDEAGLLAVVHFAGESAARSAPR